MGENAIFWQLNRRIVLDTGTAVTLLCTLGLTYDQDNSEALRILLSSWTFRAVDDIGEEIDSVFQVVTNRFF